MLGGLLWSLLSWSFYLIAVPVGILTLIGACWPVLGMTGAGTDAAGGTDGADAETCALRRPPRNHAPPTRCIAT